MPYRVAEIDVIQAALIKVLANPYRLQAIGLLAHGSLDVGSLARELGLAQAATSQHLAAMRAAGLVTAVRDGRLVRYELADIEILEACALLRVVIGRRRAAATHIATTPSQVVHA